MLYSGANATTKQSRHLCGGCIHVFDTPAKGTLPWGQTGLQGPQIHLGIQSPQAHHIACDKVRDLARDGVQCLAVHLQMGGKLPESNNGSYGMLHHVCQSKARLYQHQSYNIHIEGQRIPTLDKETPGTPFNRRKALRARYLIFRASAGEHICNEITPLTLHLVPLQMSLSRRRKMATASAWDVFLP